MENTNPFSSPLNEDPTYNSPATPPPMTRGPWRRRQWVVTKLNIPWPVECVVTGQAHDLVTVDLSVHHTPVWLMILLVLLVTPIGILGLVGSYIILDIGEETVKVTVGMTRRARRHFYFQIFLARCSMFLIAMMLIMIFDSYKSDSIRTLMQFLTALLFLAVRQSRLNRLLSLTRKPGDWLFFHGAGPGFLDLLAPDDSIAGK